ncbi:hypothetical protein PPYR_03845 [Photinus pyralis]|uniref:Uncharacterized protein n=1 Tax=Photinus pyralis TaxID=7054 RepID=A0A1Y1NMC1_PHOPY|nr:uncharacterized protein LOC116164288 [Photinus pyralis]XP_031341338.1 uncharacterized protein LOC116169392 [Photinus pyralis]KAB0799315.1 hypothetical protein PPYR_07195 [Photinus pyralis]KAB0801659.1 hypothetical protein PPYR_03845 [Photinus pyralis]
MKVALLILFVACVQATSPPFFPKDEIEKHTGHCIHDHKLDKDHISKIFNSETYPEDDKDFSTFYDCFIDMLGLYTVDGEIHFEHPIFIAYVQEKLKLADAAGEEDHIRDAVKHCIAESPKVEPRVLNLIRRRNCGVKYYKSHAH